MQKRTLTTLAACAATAFALISAPAAFADPDPHMPNGETEWCPGGRDRSLWGGRCYGVPYADNTRWVQERGQGPAGPFGPSTWKTPSCRTIASTPGHPGHAPAPGVGCGQ